MVTETLSFRQTDRWIDFKLLCIIDGYNNFIQIKDWESTARELKDLDLCVKVIQMVYLNSLLIYAYPIFS